MREQLKIMKVLQHQESQLGTQLSFQQQHRKTATSLGEPCISFWLSAEIISNIFLGGKIGFKPLKATVSFIPLKKIPPSVSVIGYVILKYYHYIYGLSNTITFPNLLDKDGLAFKFSVDS